MICLILITWTFDILLIPEGELKRWSGKWSWTESSAQTFTFNKIILIFGKMPLLTLWLYLRWSRNSLVWHVFVNGTWGFHDRPVSSNFKFTVSMKMYNFVATANSFIFFPVVFGSFRRQEIQDTNCSEIITVIPTTHGVLLSWCGPQMKQFFKLNMTTEANFKIKLDFEIWKPGNAIYF